MNAPLSPAEFGRIVRESTDEELLAGLEANRELILPELFRQMPEQLRADAAGDLDAVVEWRIRDSQGDEEAWQITIRGGRATSEREGTARPDVIYAIGVLDFVKLAAGVFRGPELFLRGRLSIKGNLFLAAQMPALFRRPGRDEGAEG